MGYDATCSSCGQAMPAGYRFCTRCGHARAQSPQRPALRLRRPSPRSLALTAAALLLLLLALTVWPTRFRYERTSVGGEQSLRTVRIDRLTGEVDLLTYDGWRRLD